MNARQCDRCKGFYKLYDGADAVHVVDREINGNYSINEKCDLCTLCMKKLKMFLSNKADIYEKESVGGKS